MLLKSQLSNKDPKIRRPLTNHKQKQTDNYYQTLVQTSISSTSFQIEFAALASGSFAQLKTLSGFVGPKVKVFFFTTVLFLAFLPNIWCVLFHVFRERS